MNQLENLHVLVTRPEPAGSELCREIEKLGAKATFFPTIDFKEPRDKAALDQALNKVGEQDWLIFISPQAVIKSVPLIRARWPNLPEGVKFAAIGKGTEKALFQAGYQTALIPETEWSTEGLMAMPEMQAPEKVMIVRGEGGRELLEKMLLERKASVTPLIVYERIKPVIDCEKARALIRIGDINRIVCGSYLAIFHLKEMLGDTVWSELRKIPVIVMSERIKELAHDLGFQTIWASRDTIAQLLKTNNKRG